MDLRFRAWTGSGFYYWSLPEKPDGHVTTHEYIKDGAPIMQYVGLEDITGRPVYSGDLVRLQTTGDKLWVIKYVEGGFYHVALDGSVAGTLGHHTPLEVVGNIYQDKELLNG